MFKGDNTVVFTDTSDRAQVTLGLDADSDLVNNNAGDSPYVPEEGDFDEYNVHDGERCDDDVLRSACRVPSSAIQ